MERLSRKTEPKTTESMTPDVIIKAQAALIKVLSAKIRRENKTSKKETEELVDLYDLLKGIIDDQEEEIIQLGIEKNMLSAQLAEAKNERQNSEGEYLIRLSEDKEFRVCSEYLSITYNDEILRAPMPVKMFRLFHLLLQNPNRVITFERILFEIWDIPAYKADIHRPNVWVGASRLKKHLTNIDPELGEAFQNQKEFGYMWVGDVVRVPRS
ncbi:MAG: helix-turn-helix domain-containing protein [Candidatus Woesebacteria bacterium]